MQCEFCGYMQPSDPGIAKRKIWIRVTLLGPTERILEFCGHHCFRRFFGMAVV